MDSLLFLSLMLNIITALIPCNNRLLGRKKEREGGGGSPSQPHPSTISMAPPLPLHQNPLGEFLKMQRHRPHLQPSPQLIQKFAGVRLKYCYLKRLNPLYFPRATRTLRCRGDFGARSLVECCSSSTCPVTLRERGSLSEWPFPGL